MSTINKLIKRLPPGLEEFISRERILPATPVPGTGSYRGTSGQRANKYDDQGNLLTSDASVNINVSAVSVGLTSVMLLDQNPTRKYLLVQNTSANTIALNFGANAALTFGLVLTSGQAYEMLRPTLQAIFAIGAAAALSVIVLEGT